MVYTLRDFGSYTVGGHVHRVTEGTPFAVNFTRSASYDVDPRGHFSVEHGYVQYYIPQNRNDEPPVLLVHGGGMTGSCWETTPDGRPGWVHLLLDRGFEVHVLDNVERGRAGFAPGLWAGTPLLRSHEEAWSLFRFGLSDGFKDRRAFAGQRFPTDDFEVFAQCFVPRWLSTTHLHSRTVSAVLDRLGLAIIVCHSQGGEITFDAVKDSSVQVASIIALEPSAMPTGVDVPVAIFAGDYLETAPHWQTRNEGWLAAARDKESVTYIGTQDLGPGHSHMPMMDVGSDLALEAMMAELAG